MSLHIEETNRPLHFDLGRCPVCEHEVRFNAWGPNLRDTYLCGVCGSIPRERALMAALERFYPNWRDLRIHESSPGTRGVSPKLMRECPGYISTQYHPTIEPGTTHPEEGWRCEDLEKQTFANGIFDLVITQDVLEHVFDVDSVCREIARTLAPGGAHIATTPLVRQTKPTILCAERLADGSIKNHYPPEMHGNPVDGSGSLVTFWWGYDIAARIDRVAPFDTLLYLVEDKSQGIAGPLNEVLISMKLATGAGDARAH